MLRLPLTLLAVLCLTAAPIFADPAADAALLKRLQGDYAMRKHVQAGKVASETFRRLRIKGDRVQFLAGKRVLLDAKLTVAASEKPAQITIHIKAPNKVERKMRGILKLEGQQLTLCFAYNRILNAKRPTTFESTAENRCDLMTLARHP